MGIVQLGKHTIRVLNLYEQLSSAGLPQLPLTQPFLLIARSAQGELCGIWLEEPPNLVELDNEMLRSTPKSDSVAVATPGSSRQYGTHEIISHVAVLSQDNFSTTIFLLDVNRVLNTALTEVS